MRLSEIKKIFHKELDELFGVAEVDSFFGLMIEQYLKLDRFILVIDPYYTLTKEEEAPFFEGLAKLRQQIPIQYILGSTTFMDLELKVDERVLIPRPETEELVRWIVSNNEATTGSNTIRILDIGTGSGSIAIALAKYIVDSEIVGIDFSSEILELATQNCINNEVAVEFMVYDILRDEADLGKFDLIVSNPPYVCNSEQATMSKNVLDYEPKTALFVPDEDPLLYYKRIADFAAGHLQDNGMLYFEINQRFGEAVVALLEEQKFSEIELKKDMHGHDRMVKARI